MTHRILNVYLSPYNSVYLPSIIQPLPNPSKGSFRSSAHQGGCLPPPRGGGVSAHLSAHPIAKPVNKTPVVWSIAGSLDGRHALYERQLDQHECRGPNRTHSADWLQEQTTASYCVFGISDGTFKSSCGVRAKVLVPCSSTHHASGFVGLVEADLGAPDMGVPDMGVPDMGVPDMGVPNQTCRISRRRGEDR